MGCQLDTYFYVTFNTSMRLYAILPLSYFTNQERSLHEQATTVGCQQDKYFLKCDSKYIN